jgi:dihydrofolate reductase
VGRIVVSEFVTVDGVAEDPGGAEGLDRGGWAFKFERGEEGDKFKLDEVMDADAMLLGRVTYEGFAAAWPDREDEAGFAAKMNGMPKFVASTTLREPTWQNSTLLEGDVVGAIRKLKLERGGDILVAGSLTLVGALTEHGLVDEYRLMVFPIVLGAGKRLFAEGGEPKSLQLVDSRPVGPDGVVVLTYRPAP